jgi:hypothetical protein
VVSSQAYGDREFLIIAIILVFLQLTTNSIVGIDAFDLREDEIDITPFLPLLCDGAAHSFEIRVSGVNDTGNGTGILSETVGDNWPVTGKVFIWLDPEGSVTTGSGPVVNAPDPVFELSSTVGKLPNGTNETLTYRITAQRQISFESTVKTANGTETAVWSQKLGYSNFGNFTSAGNAQLTKQSTSGHDVSSSGYDRTFDYPLDAYSVFGTIADNITIFANVLRGKDVTTFGKPVFPTGLESFESFGKAPTFEGSSLQTTQNGTATYLSNQTAMTSFSFGTTEQDMTFAGISSDRDVQTLQIPSSSELFHRYVKAVNGTVVQDDETVLGRSLAHIHLKQANTNNYARIGAKAMLGRGPPAPKKARRSP